MGPPEQLHDAMRYAVLAPGKRMRPLLTFGSAEALGLDPGQVDSIAAAIEIIHAYSLIHDDLPAMDDDDYRRGRPTCHRKFDEATAILAGDALQALAFEIIAEDDSVNAADRGALTLGLSRACGSLGMAGGQAIDLGAVGHTLNRDQLFEMHQLKTGALIRAAAALPAIVAHASADLERALNEYGRCVGLAFQIQDDILDVEGDPEEIGKTAGADAAMDKPTFPSILGLEASVECAKDLCAEAIAALAPFERDTSTLRQLATYAVDRTT